MEHSSSVSDDEEDAHDYDALEEKCLSRTNSRRRSSAKSERPAVRAPLELDVLEKPSRDSLSSRGSWRGIKVSVASMLCGASSVE